MIFPCPVWLSWVSIGIWLSGTMGTRKVYTLPARSLLFSTIFQLPFCTLLLSNLSSQYIVSQYIAFQLRSCNETGIFSRLHEFLVSGSKLFPSPITSYADAPRRLSLCIMQSPHLVIPSWWGTKHSNANIQSNLLHNIFLKTSHNLLTWLNPESWSTQEVC